jgi:putative Mn2+ efflux pump MntP
MEKRTVKNVSLFSVGGAIFVGIIAHVMDKAGFVPPLPPGWLITWTGWIGAFLLLGLGTTALWKKLS